MTADAILESEIERPAHQYAWSRGWFAEKIMRAGRRGFPDHIFIRNGRVVFIEFKRPGETPTPQQLKRHYEMRMRGAEVYVVDNLDEVKRILY